jgi:hypothetical protein
LKLASGLLSLHCWIESSIQLLTFCILSIVLGFLFEMFWRLDSASVLR